MTQQQSSPKTTGARRRRPIQAAASSNDSCEPRPSRSDTLRTEGSGRNCQGGRGRVGGRGAATVTLLPSSPKTATGGSSVDRNDRDEIPSTARAAPRRRPATPACTGGGESVAVTATSLPLRSAAAIKKGQAINACCFFKRLRGWGLHILDRMS